MKVFNNYKVLLFLIIGLSASGYCEAFAKSDCFVVPPRNDDKGGVIASAAEKSFKSFSEPNPKISQQSNLIRQNRLLQLAQAQLRNDDARSRTNFNKNWKFFLGDEPAAKSADFNDSKWRQLTLPHDWSIEGKFDEKNPAKPEGGGLPTGIGWYRKEFTAPANFENKLITIEFDGVYKNSEVWVNGNYLGKRPYGYSSFSYEISKFLKSGKNTVAVKVDNSAQPDSRWYSGSGIYRNVWLTSTAKVAISEHGVFVESGFVSGDFGESTDGGNLRPGQNVGFIAPKVEFVNKSSDKTKKYKIEFLVQDQAGKTVVKHLIAPDVIEDNTSKVVSSLLIDKPQIWSVERPYLYTLLVKIIDSENKLIDAKSTAFGIRRFNFDAAKGFSLNGKPMKILGVCLHHDLGALGAAINVRAMERQLTIMKAMGVNAIRTAHNPPAPEFLDLCDRMGFLVMDEAFDMWAKKKTKNDYHLNFAEWHKRDLQDMIKRDRNHPSIILWSIGNEIREQFDSTGIAITKELVMIVKNLDPNRPVISALTETDAKKNFIYQANALDIYGLNYNHKLYKDFPKNYPGVKFLATETTSALQTRGFYDTADTIRRWPKDGKTKFTEGNKEWSASAYDNVSAYWGSTHEETWKEAKKYDHVSGLFVWTGFDYLGEPLPYPWPARSSYFGIVDLAGFPKDSYYMYQSEWTNKPVLHILPHWNWEKGKSVEVWAYYNNADEVELYLNGKSLGKKSKHGEDLHVQWNVNFEPGTLKAVSRRNGKEVLVREVKTAGKPAKLKLIADRKNIKADGSDLSFVTVRILDAAGNVVPNADNLVNFKVSGNGFIAGVDNGFQASLEPFKANYRKAFHGLCLAILQATEKTGTIKLTASSAGLSSSSITINTAK